MKILILGGTGMLGHALYRQWRDTQDVWVTSRSSFGAWRSYDLFARDRFLGGVDVMSPEALTRVVARTRPDAIVNCVGIVKQLAEAKDPLLSISINSLLPHRLADLADASGARLVHVSTDCVFSGVDGGYSESDISDAEDLYGRSKFLGEVDRPGAITLRTSIVGRELQTSSGLIEWFLSTTGTVRGFDRAIYTGLTTQELGRVILNVLTHHPQLHGVWQVSSERISKYELLQLVRARFAHDVTIDRDDTVAIDRSLDSSRFRAATGYVAPGWDAMIDELAADRTIYDKWRHTRVT